jgi:2-hydroxyacyl-CoA lyase 1
MAEIDGATLVARCLKQQGIDELFGVVGIPVTGIALAAPGEGIRYVGMRHEQAAGYAAQAISYMKGRIGACIVVSGPGMTNAISALGNAWSNCWPMLLIGGSSNQILNHMGDFQAAPQVELARPFCKWVGQAERIEHIPRYIATAVRLAISGRPGPVYLDLPGDIIMSRIDESKIDYPPRVEAPPTPTVDPALIKKALGTLRSARQPLAIIGKGAAWARAEEQVRRFIDETQMPFLASPMGKGVVPDDHPLSVAAARTYALQNTDLVFFDWRPPQLDHALWLTAPVPPGSARGAAGHCRRGNRHQCADRGAAGWRCEGGDDADGGSAGRGPVADIGQ